MYKRQGYEFVNGVVGGAIPKEYIPAVDNGIQGAMKSGVLAGYPVVDVKVTLWDGSYHEVDSSEMAFSIAGSMAFKDAMKTVSYTHLDVYKRQIKGKVDPLAGLKENVIIGKLIPAGTGLPEVREDLKNREAERDAEVAAEQAAAAQ